MLRNRALLAACLAALLPLGAAAGDESKKDEGAKTDGGKTFGNSDLAKYHDPDSSDAASAPATPPAPEMGGGRDEAEWKAQSNRIHAAEDKVRDLRRQRSDVEQQLEDAKKDAEGEGGGLKVAAAGPYDANPSVSGVDGPKHQLVKQLETQLAKLDKDIEAAQADLESAMRGDPVKSSGSP
ncbi:MAG: hypothetical protein U0166_29475 [Acidobacteriota bacterium]